MLTEKDYCDYNLVLELKNLGYDYIRREGLIHLYEAQKFLREEKKLHITIYSQSQESWQYRITKPHQKLEDGLHGEDFSSYEEALSECIKKIVKLLKEEK